MNEVLRICIALVLVLSLSCNNEKQTTSGKQAFLKVPEEFSTIAGAVANADTGDMIIISPGIYVEHEIEINKAITISSEWKIDGDESKIDKTIIDSEDKILFTINADSVEISGLKIVNGNHTLNIEANVSILHNHFLNNLDGMSFESGGGGYVGYNTAENDRDDALDLDIRVDEEDSGSDILIEHNVFINSDDDGIEIRLFKPHNQNVKYTIRENHIIGSNNAGIQLISYDEFTGKQFNIHHNIFMNCKTGLGCMEGAQTKEDLSGATKMDELVYFYNNTVTGCQMGATGGNRIMAYNNLIVNNSLGGFKMFGAKSVVFNNLFFQNGGDDFIEINPSVIMDGNLLSINPIIDENTLYPAENSPCIDAGISELNPDDTGNFKISPEYIAGKAPDIGAVEFGLDKKKSQEIKLLQVDAGEDQAVKAPATAVVLAGRIRNADDPSLSCNWKQEQGPAEAEIVNPNKLITDVIFEKEGIYRFSVQCSGEQSSASDFVVVRYFKDGEGKQLFLSEEKTNTIEAGNFAYTYGNVNLVNKKYLQLTGPETQAEFSVGMAESSEYDVWILVKSENSGEAKLQVEFNNRLAGEISAVEKSFRWVKLPKKIRPTPGQWQLLISSAKGEISLNKIIFSTNPDFSPQ